MNIGTEKIEILSIHYNIGETDLANYPKHIFVCILEKMKRFIFVQCKLANPLFKSKTVLRNDEGQLLVIFVCSLGNDNPFRIFIHILFFSHIQAAKFQ